MIKQSELEVMVCDLFVDAYRAGASGGDLAYNAARGTRARLIAKFGLIYAELEQESYHREQFEVELNKANKRIECLQRDYNDMRDVKDRLLLFIREKDESLQEDDAPAPDDMEPELRDCLPFPDVEDLAPASELLGGDERC